MIGQFRRHLFGQRFEFIGREERELIRVDVLAARSILLPQELRDAMALLRDRLLILGIRLGELRDRGLLLQDDRLQRGDVIGQLKRR